MRQLLLYAVLLALLGCGGGSSDSKAPVAYEGTWGYDDANTKIRVNLALLPDKSGYSGTIHSETYSSTGIVSSLDGQVGSGLGRNQGGGLANVAPIDLPTGLNVVYPSLHTDLLARPVDGEISVPQDASTAGTYTELEFWKYDCVTNSGFTACSPGESFLLTRMKM